MTDHDAVLEHCRRLLDSGADIESVLRALRDHGYSKAQSIKALVDLNRAGLAEAKVFVHQSDAWKDTRERDEAFQKSLGDEDTDGV